MEKEGKVSYRGGESEENIVYSREMSQREKTECNNCVSCSCRSTHPVHFHGNHVPVSNNLSHFPLHPCTHTTGDISPDNYAIEDRV